MKAYVCTNGCPENRIDAALMRKLLIENGFEPTNDNREADLCLFNACALTEDMEENSIVIVERLKAEGKPSSRLIVCGCLAKVNIVRLRQTYDGPTFGSDDIGALAEILNSQTNLEDLHVNTIIPWLGIKDQDRDGSSITRKALKHLFRESPFSPWLIVGPLFMKLTAGYYRSLCRQFTICRTDDFGIKVSTGCANACSYCSVKLSRGHVKSKPIQNVVGEFREGLARGFKEFSLLGTDLGSYGMDQGTNIAALLKAITGIEGDYKIRVRNLHPSSLIQMLPELLEVVRTGKISYISSALQSGNDRILGLMNRHYKVEELKEAVQAIKRECPEMEMCTQVMVAFPGESEEEFKDTLTALGKMKYDFTEVYRFSPRANTAASKMPYDIPEPVARRRNHEAFTKALGYTTRACLARSLRYGKPVKTMLN